MTVNDINDARIDLQKKITLQYISQGKNPEDHIFNINKACASGIKWIQLRLKNIPYGLHLETAKKCKEICCKYSAIFLVNDHVEIAKEALADGVHLGLGDMDPKQARLILGNHTIIGGTANTLEDCKLQLSKNVDYIGLGPYQYTTTKKKLSPVLGVTGYQSILRSLNTKVPIIAIGGIEEQDIDALLKTGITGIAASGLLTSPKDNFANTVGKNEYRTKIKRLYTKFGRRFPK